MNSPRPVSNGNDLTQPQALPNLLIIGAPKAGTTTLHRSLAHHPDVFMTRVKEPGFFWRDDHFARGLTYYSREFFQGGEAHKVRGESTPWYLYSPEATERIAASLLMDTLKLVVILRDPVDRAYSQYLDQVRAGFELRSFEEATDLELQGADIPRLASRYLYCSRYVAHLQRYVQVFGRERILVLLHDDLAAEPHGVIRTVLAHVGVEPDDAVGPFEATRANASGALRSRTLNAGMRAVLRSPRMRAFAGRHVPARIYRPAFQKLVAWNRRPVEPAPLDAALRQHLRHEFTNEVSVLQSTIGRDLSAWATGANR